MRTLAVRMGSDVVVVTITSACDADLFEGRAAVVDQWVKYRIAKPHPDQGRDGPMCPFVPAAMRRETVAYAVIPGNLTFGHMIGVISSLGVFFDTRRLESRFPVLEALICVFSEIPEVPLRRAILDLHDVLKDSFVRNGRMLGEFVPGHPQPGIHNPNFRPLASPIPLLVIRSMVKDDDRFLTQQQDWLDVHAARFGRQRAANEA